MLGVSMSVSEMVSMQICCVIEFCDGMARQRMIHIVLCRIKQIAHLQQLIINRNLQYKTVRSSILSKAFNSMNTLVLFCAQFWLRNVKIYRFFCLFPFVDEQSKVNAQKTLHFLKCVCTSNSSLFTTVCDSVTIKNACQVPRSSNVH